MGINETMASPPPPAVRKDESQAPASRGAAAAAAMAPASLDRPDTLCPADMQNLVDVTQAMAEKKTNESSKRSFDDMSAQEMLEALSKKLPDQATKLERISKAEQKKATKQRHAATCRVCRTLSRAYTDPALCERYGLDASKVPPFDHRLGGKQCAVRPVYRDLREVLDPEAKESEDRHLKLLHAISTMMVGGESLGPWGNIGDFAMTCMKMYFKFKMPSPDAVAYILGHAIKSSPADADEDYIVTVASMAIHMAAANKREPIKNMVNPVVRAVVSSFKSSGNSDDDVKAKAEALANDEAAARKIAHAAIAFWTTPWAHGPTMHASCKPGNKFVPAGTVPSLSATPPPPIGDMFKFMFEQDDEETDEDDEEIDEDDEDDEEGDEHQPKRRKINSDDDDDEEDEEEDYDEEDEEEDEDATGDEDEK